MRNFYKKIFITGGSGYIGRCLVNKFKDKYNTFAIGRKNINLVNYDVCDLTDSIKLKNVLNKILPNVIIHCAGISSVEFCEKYPHIALEINFHGTKNLISIINQLELEVKFIFISSDYVFRGTSGNYKENDSPDPVTIYGKTKYEVEKLIQSKFSNYMICRTAAVYGYGGNSFFNFVLDNLNNKRRIEIFQDNFFTPTQITNLLEVIDIIISEDICGVLHTVGSERISRFNFVRKIARRFGFDTDLIVPINKPLDSLIPYDSSLNSDKTQKLLGIKLFSVDEGLSNLKSFYY